MALILGIETATTICSVALVKDGNTMAIRESGGNREHSAALTGYIAEVFAEAGLTYGQIDAVAVSMGPGSYTGLRIGVSSAKGLCYATDKPFIAIDTLKSLAWQALQKLKAENTQLDNVLLCPMLDARRMEVYAEVLDRSLKVVRPIQADIVDAETYKEYLDGHHVYFFGNGAAKCMETINHPHAHLVEGIEPLAKNMAPLAEKRFVEGKFEDVAYFVPFYLKDFVAKMPKKLI